MKKIVVLLLCVSVILASFAGCKSSEVGKSYEITHNLGTEYPLKTDKTLTVWCEFPKNAMENAQNLNDLPLGKELEKQTGVHIEYMHPTSDESFNLMLASGKLPDIIMYRWPTFAGGADKAINDGYIYKLNEIVDEYCPDFKTALDKYNAKKYYSTDDGSLYYFPGLWNSDSVLTAGMILRKDWLDELKLDVPETIDEWHTVLTAFKEKKGASAPLSPILQTFQDGNFTGAYGIKLNYYIDNGKVKNGYFEQSYKDFLELMVKWREEGLLDKNFSTLDGQTVSSNFLSGKTGAQFGSQGSTMGTYLNMAHDDKKFDVVAAPYPVMNKGEKCNVAKKNAQSSTQMGAAITTACKDVELAAKWLNYGYTQKGAYTYAFGIEGESYNIIDGYPTYTDLVMKNPDGATVKSMLDRYTRSATTSGPFIKDYRYLEQYAQYPQQKTALKIWSDYDGEGHELPPLFFDASEQAVISEKVNTVKTYQEEMLYKFISGEEPLSNFDKYIENMKGNGAQDILDAYQSAYDRYTKR